MIALLAALLGSAVQVTPVHAASIVVNTDVDQTDFTIQNNGCTLREALYAATFDTSQYTKDNKIYNLGCTAGSGADVITFAGNYTITVASQLPYITTEINIIGNGAANTIIQAASNPNVATWRVFQVTQTPLGNLTLDGVTVRNG